MKKILYSIFVATLFLTSCSDFLEESSQDEIRPTTTEDMAAVLYKEAYPYLLNTDGYLALLTDEVENHQYLNESYKDRMANGKPVYSFSKTMFDGEEPFLAEENSWKNYYEMIKGCNVVLDYIYDMKGKEIDRKYIAGQARALRAYYYMKLLMIYCLPYDETIADKELGLVHILSSHVSDEFPTRQTLRQTYDLVESELLLAKEEIKGFVPSTYYRINETGVDILLSRLYLYEKKWDKCVSSASAAIKGGPRLTDLNANKYASVWDITSSPEIVWNYTGSTIACGMIGARSLVSGGYLPYNLSQKVMGMYAEGDLRYCKKPVLSELYVQGGTNYGYYSYKMKAYSSQNGEGGLRMSEAYLNRAEAYAEMGDMTKAAEDINMLRMNRFYTTSYQPVEYTDDAEFKMFIRDERQRELVWEGGFRWMDIKRYGLSVEHIFTTEEGVVETYTLKENDPLYALPIPYDAIVKNPNLQQNKR